MAKQKPKKQKLSTHQKAKATALRDEKKKARLNRKGHRPHAFELALTRNVLTRKKKAQNKTVDEIVEELFPVLYKKSHKDISWNVLTNRLRIILEVFRKHASKALINNHYVALKEVCYHEPLNNPISWNKKGKSATSILNSFIEHSFSIYAVPKFMLQGWHNTYECELWARLYICLGKGESPYKNNKNNELIPVSLTKKMWHTFLTQGKDNPTHSIRIAQTLNLGGDKRLAKALYNALGHNNLGNLGWAIPPTARMNKPSPFIIKEEEKTALFIQWICNQHMMDHVHIHPLWDYYKHMLLNMHRRNQPEGYAEYSLKGRTFHSVMVAMEEWHVELYKNRGLAGTPATFEPCGIGPYEPEPKKDTPNWTIVEILSKKALIAEGKTMQHCVVSYSGSIISKRTSIWSMAVDTTRKLTVEVINASREIVQAKGKYNRSATKHERSILRRWANKENLKIGKYL